MVPERQVKYRPGPHWCRMTELAQVNRRRAHEGRWTSRTN